MATKGVVIQITGDGASAAKALEMVDQHLKETAAEAKNSGSSIAESMGAVQEALGTIGLSVGIGEAIAKVKEMITSSVELGMEIGHLAEKTGISTQTLSGLKYVSDVTGVSFESLQRASKKLSTEMLGSEEGAKASVQAFARLGITQEEVRKHSNDLYGMLEILADKFQAMPDGPQKAAVAVQLLGKTGMDLIPILNQGSAGLEKMKSEAESLGLVLDEAGVAKMQAMHQAGVELDGAMQGLALSLTNALGPSLIGAAELMEKLLVKIREMKGFGNEGVSGYGQYIDKATYGLAGKNLASAGSSAQTGAAAAQAELTDLDAKQAKKLISAKDYQAKKLAAQKEFYSQSQAAAAVDFQIQLDRIHALQEDSDNLQKVHPITSGFGAGASILLKNQADIETATGLAHKAGEAAKDASEKFDALGKKPGPGLILQPEGGGRGGRGSSKAASDAQAKAIAEQAKALAEANATATAAAVKSADELGLAELEAGHKLMLISDADYYDEKQALAQHSIEAEMAAVKDRMGSLTDDGAKVTELKNQRELIQLNQQLNELETKRATLDIGSDASGQERANAGAALAIEQARAKQLQTIADLEHQIEQITQSNKDATGVQKDREEKDPTQRVAATKEINALNAQTAATLKDLVKQYDVLAVALGGDFIEKAKALHAEMDKLNTPDKKVADPATKALGEGMTSMAEKMAQATGKGRQSFHAMAMGIEADLVELAVKFAAQKWLAPFMNSLGASLGGGGGAGSGGTLFAGGGNELSGYAAGGDPTGPSIVGEAGPELFFPKGPGTVMPNDALQNLSKTSGGGGAPNMTMNVTNASSQPVTARQTGSSFDADTRSYMTHVILEDLSQGGPISSALRPGG